MLAAAARGRHVDTVRSELLKVLGSLVTDIEEALSSEAAAVGSEARFLRLVRTLTAPWRPRPRPRGAEEVFREASKGSVVLNGFEEARVETLWDALEKTLERLDEEEPPKDAPRWPTQLFPQLFRRRFAVSCFFCLFFLVFASL